ncbi:MAG: succinylglutamate desuccinylase/aspartoacylase family protein [Bacteroidetes bacterium]|jgi:predicted deacylase|nr:succinylglutamate desuccinylase/aspartoacylase family protein [Bacteroidota bacterium]
MSISKIRILNTDIKPGKRTVINLDIARLHTRTKIEVPVIIERGRKDGPCLMLTAGIHGDETNGVEIVRQIVAKGYNKPKAGMVICIPVVNIFGFINNTRSLPDGRDLNRVFPGSENGSLASRFAHALIHDVAPYIDYSIDYHTGGAGRFNYTQVRVDSSDPESLQMAKVFGTRFILHAKNRDKSFREALTGMGKKVLLFEGGKSMNLDRKITHVGIAGALRVMQHMGLRDFSRELQELQSTPPSEVVHISDSSWIRAKYSGMYRSWVRNGAHVEKGESLGSISDPFGEFEKEVKAPHAGYVICANHAPIVNQGDALVHLTLHTELLLR